MSALVIDSSVALAWCFVDERNERLAAIEQKVTDSGAVVPGHWHLEMANILVMAVRRGRITEQQRDVYLQALSSLPIEIDGETSARAWNDTVQLAEAHRLTVYDAAYLELAVRRRIPLATLDSDLGKAAASEGLTVLGT